MGVLLCLYYSTRYMTDIVIFPKIIRRNFFGEGKSAVQVRGNDSVLMVFGGKGGCALRPKQPFEGGTNVYPKPMPKQDKGGGIDPPPRALACGLDDDAAGRRLPPLRIPSPALRLLATRGKPAFGGKDKKRYITFSCIIFEPASIRYSILLADAISRAASAFARTTSSSIILSPLTSMIWIVPSSSVVIKSG